MAWLAPPGNVLFVSIIVQCCVLWVYTWWQSGLKVGVSGRSRSVAQVGVPMLSVCIAILQHPRMLVCTPVGGAPTACYTHSMCCGACLGYALL